MQRILNNVTPLRTMRKGRVVKRFYMEQASKGVKMRDLDVPELLYGTQTVVIDASLIMEGRNTVRMVAAPLMVCTIDKFKRQGSWMMLTAGVALGCDGYAPLEEFARVMNFERSRMLKQYPQISTIPYDHIRKLETTVHRDANGVRAFTKGEPEAVLSCCSQVLDGKERKLTDMDHYHAMEAAREMESRGLETLAFATMRQVEDCAFEQDMVFLGIVGMGDLPNAEAPIRMDMLRQLGIRPIVVSREHLSQNAVRLTGAVRPNADMVYVSDVMDLEDFALRKIALNTDAFLGFSNAQRRRLLRALRVRETIAVVLTSPEGGIAISTGTDDEDDVVLPRGNLLDVAMVFQDCYALMTE